MPYINEGRLTDRLKKCDPGKTALLIIDEGNAAVNVAEAAAYSAEDRSPANITGHQVYMLNYAQAKGMKVYSISYDTVGVVEVGTKKGSSEYDTTRADLKKHYWDGRVEYSTKNKANAFIGTDLNGVLKSDGIETVVLMGFHAGACVAATSGGQPWSHLESFWGAVQYGFKVMSCRQILHGDDGGPPSGKDLDWSRHPDIEFYANR